MKYVVKHGMSDLGQVRKVIDKAFDAYRERLADYDPQMNWVTENQANVSFAVMKKKIEAKFSVDPQEVRVEGDIPFLFRPFEGRIKNVIGEEVEKWIAKAKAGEI